MADVGAGIDPLSVPQIRRYCAQVQFLAGLLVAAAAQLPAGTTDTSIAEQIQGIRDTLDALGLLVRVQ